MELRGDGFVRYSVRVTLGCCRCLASVLPHDNAAVALLLNCRIGIAVFRATGPERPCCGRYSTLVYMSVLATALVTLVTYSLHMVAVAQLLWRPNRGFAQQVPGGVLS